MPAKQGNPDILSKYGVTLDKHIQQHAKDETKRGLIDLPPGVKGVARLTEARFGQYKEGPNKGEAFLYMAARVCEPDVSEWKGHKFKVRDGITKQTLPFCASRDKSGKETRSMEDNISTLLNHIRLLGGEDCLANCKSSADLMRIVEVIAKKRPYFEFSTQARKDRETGKELDSDPWHNWHGWERIKDYKEPARANKVDDDATGAPTPSNGAPTAPVNRVSGVLPPPAATEEAEEPFDDGATLADEAEAGAAESGGQASADEIAELVVAAKRADGKAQNKLESMAIAAGHSKEAVELAEHWEDVAHLIANPAGGSDGGEKDDSEPSSEPEKGAMVKYRPIDKKTGRPRQRPVDCEVTAVQKRKKTCDLKNYDDPKIVYSGVSWDDLDA